jgi:hypothetical protein
MTENNDAVEIAKALHVASYEAERETGWPYRDFISFDGMPLEYQNLAVKAIEKLIEQGVIKKGTNGD